MRGNDGGDGAAEGDGITEGGGGRRPNILYVFSDQWRACDHGYTGNREVRTPHIDAFSRESVNFRNAVSGIPVCCPHRACLLTGQFPLTHGLFLNDLCLNNNATSFAQALNGAGYHTGYIGKWHIDGHGRGDFTPPERRQGFAYWRALECTHNYNNSRYYAGDDPEPRQWEGYDAIAQTREAESFLRENADAEKPFALFLSWGPPHAPYRMVPPKYLKPFDTRRLTVRPNVPEADRERAQPIYAGYYAHMAALDDAFASLLGTLEELGLDDNTIVVYTSDHGDMLLSQGNMKKQQPWDESCHVPFLLRYPDKLGRKPRAIEAPINTPDIMPTLLGLAGVEIPETVEGDDFSGVLLGAEAEPEDNPALILCPAPFGQWSRGRGGREYRGVRTKRYTYARHIDGPWLLYDNLRDPYQMDNLVGKEEHAEVQARLEAELRRLLEKTGDAFQSAGALIAKCGYKVDATGTVAYQSPEQRGQYSVRCREG